MRLIRSKVATTVAASAALIGGGLATAAPAHADLAPQSTFTMPVNETNGQIVTLPTSGEAIPNVDSVKSTIRKYYNATGGLANRSTSPYISEVAAKQAEFLASLPADSTGKAVVFDADDTLLWNYDYEDKGSNFVYDPTSNAAWVTGKNADGSAFDCLGGTKTGSFCFPQVPGAAAMVREVASRGYAVYVVTGRPAAQKTATIDNLTAAGFTSDGTPGGTPLFNAGNVFAKDIANQPWVDLAADGTSATTAASTVEYKAQTREHIEATDHVEIVANMGDQLSDLWGGYANQAWKIPNPTYFLSSPDLDAAHRGADDQAADLTLPDDYTMAPDGSSGATVKGDAIPNIDPVRTEIRAFYNATNGIADKTKSPYISQVTSLEKAWTSEIVTSCQTQLAKVDAANGALASATARVHAAAHRVTVDKRRLHRAHGAKAKRQARRALRKAQRQLTAAKAALAGIQVPGKPAVILDSDDTTLWNYDMEDGAMKFVFSPALQNVWVQGEQMNAVPGMPQLVAKVADAGCTIMGLTGRSNDQKYATLGNLAKNGYTDFTRQYFFTKWYDQNDPADVRAATRPAYLSGCATATCSTIDYKSLTRKHIESDLGFDIVANLGDQYSDLIGGFADKTYKLPNPTYYLP